MCYQRNLFLRFSVLALRMHRSGLLLHIGALCAFGNLRPTIIFKVKLNCNLEN